MTFCDLVYPEPVVITSLNLKDINRLTDSGEKLIYFRENLYGTGYSF